MSMPKVPAAEPPKPLGAARARRRGTNHRHCIRVPSQVGWVQYVMVRVWFAVLLQVGPLQVPPWAVVIEGVMV